MISATPGREVRQELYLKALLQIEIWVDDVPFKKYLETENPVD